MKRILVTGGGGFIGSYVAEWLGQRPGVVIVKLGDGATQGVRLGGGRTLVDALRDEEPFDAVVHLAAHIGPSADGILAANFHGIHDMLDYCNHSKVGCLVHLSRSFLVKRLDATVSSSRLGNLYEYSKRYAELVLHEQAQIPTRILRISAPVWPTMPQGRYLSQILLSIARGVPVQIYGGGRRRQNYVRLDDIAAAVWSAMTDVTSNRVIEYWTVGPENFTDFELAQAVCERLHATFKFDLVARPPGQTLDESDYGIARSDFGEDQFMPPTSRAIDEAYLRAHMNAISSLVSQ